MPLHLFKIFTKIMEGHFGRGQVVFKFSFQRTVILLWLILNTKKKTTTKKTTSSTLTSCQYLNVSLLLKQTRGWCILILIISSSSRLICRSLRPSNLYPYYFRKEMERWLREAYLRRVFNIWYYGLGVGCLFGGGHLFKEISLQIMLLFVYTTTRKRFFNFDM